MSDTLCLSCEIPERIQWLPEEGADVSNNVFHSPLRRKPEWSQPMRLSCKMSEGVYALAYKMQTIWVATTIEGLEFENPSKEEFVRSDQLFS